MTEDKPSWKYRRRVVFLTLAAAIIGVTYITLLNDSESELHQDIAAGLINVIGAIIAIYVGGAVGDDFLQKKARKYESYTADSQSSKPLPPG